MWRKWFINNIAVFCLLMLSVCVIAQDSTKTSKFSLGLNASYDISYRSLSPNSEGKNIPVIVNEVIPLSDSLESSINAYSIGISAIYNLNKRFAIESGALYSKKGHKIDEVWFFNNEGRALDTGEVIVNFSFIDIPVNVNFFIINNKLKLFLKTGATINLLVNNSSNFKGKRTDRTEQSDVYPLFNYSVNVGLGIDYSMNEKWYIRVNPQYQKFISNISRGFNFNYINRLPYSYGLNFGVYYRF